MHTTKDKLTAYITMWLVGAFISTAITSAIDNVWGLVIPVFCLFMSFVQQTQLTDWLYYYADEADIKMMADMDRPE